MKKIKRPTEKQEAAYRLYESLGKKRSIRTVAQLLGLSEPTIAQWCTKFGWVARAERKNLQEIRDVQREVNKKNKKSKEDYRELICELLEEFKGQLIKGRVKPKTITDLEKLLKLDLILMGEASEKEEIKIVFEDVEADAGNSTEEN